MPEIDLQKLAQSCIGFTEFVAKAEAALENPQKHLKQQQANANIIQIANSCLTFSQFIAKMEGENSV